jgi:hypothetical protein
MSSNLPGPNCGIAIAILAALTILIIAIATSASSQNSSTSSTANNDTVSTAQTQQAYQEWTAEATETAAASPTPTPAPIIFPNFSQWEKPLAIIAQSDLDNVQGITHVTVYTSSCGSIQDGLG